eukprot:IDg4426t1
MGAIQKTSSSFAMAWYRSCCLAIIKALDAAFHVLHDIRNLKPEAVPLPIWPKQEIVEKTLRYQCLFCIHLLSPGLHFIFGEGLQQITPKKSSMYRIKYLGLPKPSDLFFISFKARIRAKNRNDL